LRKCGSYIWRGTGWEQEWGGAKATALNGNSGPAEGRRLSTGEKKSQAIKLEGAPRVEFK